MSRAIAVYHGQFGRATLYQLNRYMTMHAHREGHVILHVGGASAFVTVSGRRYPLTLQQGVVINPWELHDFEATDLIEGSRCLVLYIKPSWFADFGSSEAGDLSFGRTQIRVAPDISGAVDDVLALLTGCGPLCLFDISLHQLMQRCFEASWQEMNPVSSRDFGGKRCSDFRVRKSLRLMAERLGSDIDLNDVAREAGLSRPHFYKLFRKQMGITPNVYLNTLIVEKAIDGLTRTEKSVTHIGYELGFPSQSGFTRFFSANVGMAPTDYRRVAQVLHH